MCSLNILCNRVELAVDTMAIGAWRGWKEEDAAESECLGCQRCRAVCAYIGSWGGGSFWKCEVSKASSGTARFRPIIVPKKKKVPSNNVQQSKPAT